MEEVARLEQEKQMRLEQWWRRYKRRKWDEVQASLELWEQLTSSKLLSEEVEVGREGASERFKGLVKVLSKDIFERVRESSFEFL